MLQAPTEPPSSHLPRQKAGGGRLLAQAHANQLISLSLVPAGPPPISCTALRAPTASLLSTPESCPSHTTCAMILCAHKGAPSVCLLPHSWHLLAGHWRLTPHTPIPTPPNSTTLTPFLFTGSPVFRARAPVLHPAPRRRCQQAAGPRWHQPAPGSAARQQFLCLPPCHAPTRRWQSAGTPPPLLSFDSNPWQHSPTAQSPILIARLLGTPPTPSPPPPPFVAAGPYPSASFRHPSSSARAGQKATLPRHSTCPQGQAHAWAQVLPHSPNSPPPLNCARHPEPKAAIFPLSGDSAPRPPHHTTPCTVAKSRMAVPRT